MGAGALLVLRPVLPAVRPIRAGVACLIAGLALGLAAGTFGLGPGGRRAELWDPAWVKPRGGMVGEALYWAQLEPPRRPRRERPGRVPVPRRRPAADRRDDRGRDHRHPRLGLHDRPAAARSDHRGARPRRPAPRRRPRSSPSSSATGAARVTAAPAESAFWSGEERFPELYDGAGELEAELEAAEEAEEPAEAELPPPEDEEDAGEPSLAEDPETDEPGVTRTGHPRPVDAAQLTPQGRYRAEVTDSPDFVWTVPDAALPQALERGVRSPRHRRPGARRRPADRGARALRRRRRA